MSFFGVQLNSQVSKLIFEIRLQLSRNKYAPNIRTIYRSFSEFDSEISGVIRTPHFEKALNSNGIFFKKYQLQVFEKAYGESGKINWFNFLSHLREPMGPVKRRLVEEIFDSIDTQKRGKITVQQLFSVFNARENQLYLNGKRDLQQVYDHFVSMLAVTQGSVTRDEFIAFHDDLNINFGHNDVFIRYVSNQWNYTPAKQQFVSQDDIKRATIQLRYRLIERSQGTKDQLLVRKLLQEFDCNKNYNLGPYDLDLMMKKLGVAASAQLTEVIHSRIDRNQTGFIQFQEFKQFLFHSPYPL